MNEENLGRVGVPNIHIIGGGLSGCEAAHQCLLAGLKVTIHEMRPYASTGAHRTGQLAELVCSNSFKSESLSNASGLLKYEMASMLSLTMMAAATSSVPAGDALAVDREMFSDKVENILKSYEKFYIERQEITQLPNDLGRDIWIVATGPLTSEHFMDSLSSTSEEAKETYFYDAIAPIIAADSIEYAHVFWGSRWQNNSSDYLNIPLTQLQYEEFVDAIMLAEKIAPKDFEDPKYFESCLPIEVMAERGIDTLRFGPLKPVGLCLPDSGEQPYAVVQLRRENLSGSMLNMVGFQTKMKWSEQKKIFRSLPGLQNAEFLRYGSIHRNTYLNGPRVLNRNLSLKGNPSIFAAGQITGVEGYLESALTGIIVGRTAAAQALGTQFQLPPVTTMSGALLGHVTTEPLDDFQPMNANTGLLTPVKKIRGESKLERKRRQILIAKSEFDRYLMGLAK